MPLPLLSPKDLHFSLELIQLSKIGVMKRTDDVETLSTENHGIYPREILENTRMCRLDCSCSGSQ